MSQVRRRKKRLKKGFWTGRRVALVAGLSVLLIALSVYFVTKYRHDLLYAQYPLRYKEEIVRYSAEYGLEPWHLAAVVRC